MTAVVAGVGVEVPRSCENSGSGPVGWPAWQVPAAASERWLELQVALAMPARRIPCQEQPDVWFASAKSPALIEAAVFGCSRCPVRIECASYALAADERDGVWGGLTEIERRAIAGRSR